MSKFAIFTMVLAMSVITITADLLIHKYVAVAGQASVLGAPRDKSPVLDEAQDTDPFKPEDTKDNNSAGAQANSPSTPTAPITPIIPDVPTSPVIKTPEKPKITEAVIKQAGFTGKLKEQLFQGKLYQLLDISKIPVQSIGHYQVVENTIPAVTITEIVLADEIQALQMYSLLQNKTKPYIDLSLNETNAYGDRSFYINHSKKKDEAFLTVKVKNRIYGFAYVKFYHPELKKLLQLLI